MKSFVFSLSVIAGLLYFSFHQRKVETLFNKININGAVRVQFANLNEAADFQQIGNADIKKVDADLARANLTRISPAFISKNGNYVLTFAKTTDEQFKRVLFVEGKINVDDVTEISKNRIATSAGEIQSISGMTSQN